MQRFALLLWVTAMLWPCAAEAQGDGCQGALNALNRVKEQITPTLSANTAGGKKRLEVMQSALENGTHLCKDNPELWFYRMAVSQRLGLDKDYRYAKDKVDESGYDNHFDPVSYTHLDVYKRQLDGRLGGHIDALDRLVAGFAQQLYLVCHRQQFATGDFKDFRRTPRTGPVSYTHLDVYKRQGL